MGNCENGDGSFVASANRTPQKCRETKIPTLLALQLQRMIRKKHHVESTQQTLLIIFKILLPSCSFTTKVFSWPWLFTVCAVVTSIYRSAIITFNVQQVAWQPPTQGLLTISAYGICVQNSWHFFNNRTLFRSPRL